MQTEMLYLMQRPENQKQNLLKIAAAQKRVIIKQQQQKHSKMRVKLNLNQPDLLQEKEEQKHITIHLKA